MKYYWQPQQRVHTVRPEKVVYVLGAGFSKPAGTPDQNEILSAILTTDPDAPRLLNPRLPHPS